ncbi:DUF4169 family protein [Aliishimia ponticola]|uniref:DUF4169 family protein n=1 Tax=Aliishimia ponticola TaxID=2499833 RepID=A0A4S4NIG9_9RHOB|nr:DUF4169 family protein [Aliishimia ponticola]THH38685.1 DUF4169 family protein [Aliishimia ponticola]
MTVVNLNKARKAKARAQERARADENAVKFGRSKAEKTAAKTVASKAEKDLDGHKRDR